MTPPIFDSRAFDLRRRRALGSGPRLFLAERIVQDLAERLAYVRRSFGRALLIGAPDEGLAEPLAGAADQLVLAPDLDALASFPEASFDLVLVLGQLDTAEELPAVLHVLHSRLAPGGLLAGAFPGNDSLPALRRIMLAADLASGAGAAARVHPRIEASAVAPLLQQAGFVAPVVDIDRVRLRYRRFADLVSDLRGMAATNVLAGRSTRPLTRAALRAAQEEFDRLGVEDGDGPGTVETVELIHFAAWSPESDSPERA